MESITYCFNPDQNGGQALTLTIESGEIGCSTEILTLDSHGNQASFITYQCFTSEKLFELARKVLEFELEIKSKNS